MFGCNEREHDRPENSFLPSAPAFRLLNARVPAAFLTDGVPAGATLDTDDCAIVDILIAHGRFGPIRPAGQSTDAALATLPAADLAGRQAWPRLVDMHTHLDKGHTVARTPNPTGDFPGARDATSADRTAHWDAADLRRRMEFGLACAFAHGTGRSARISTARMAAASAIRRPSPGACSGRSGTPGPDGWRSRASV